MTPSGNGRGGPAENGRTSGLYMITSDCTRCGVCEYMCPQDAIKEAPHQFVIRRHSCDGCAECVPYCPVRAIVPADEFAARQQETRKAQLRRVLQRD